MPKYSIIIPVYNVEKYIKKCLDSVFSQTDKDFEVIVVNDGTKDNSMDIVKKYDVKIINQKNQGLSVARNRGVKEAVGHLFSGEGKVLQPSYWIQSDTSTSTPLFLQKNGFALLLQQKMGRHSGATT